MQAEVAMHNAYTHIYVKIRSYIELYGRSRKS